MVAKKEMEIVEPRVTIDELKHRAQDVKSKAIAEGRAAVDVVMGQDATRTLLIVAGLVVVAASVAFFVGANSQRRG